MDLEEDPYARTVIMGILAEMQRHRPTDTVSLP
jgi:hypothetical protein